MQHFTDKALEEIFSAYSEVQNRDSKLTIKIYTFTSRLENERAIEFMQHGVNRRLGVIYRCLENIFTTFPPNRIELLDRNDRLDVEINLHAFLINVYGIIESTGLALAHENDLIGEESDHKLPAQKISLFKRRFRRLLNPNLCAYLRRSTTTQWFNEYAKNYRDALAHRIPPYVPPSALKDEEARRYKFLEKEASRLRKEGNFEQIEAIQNEQNRLGKANPLFVHSFSEEAKPVYLHPQLIADFRTVEELVDTAISNFYCEC